jgi:AraC-like DNA-binding protein
LQKNAKSVSKLNRTHSGILDRDHFNEHLDLRVYAPSHILEPFVEYIWIQRQKKPLDPAYTPIEICSGPNVYIFLTAQSSFIHGTVAQEFQYDAHASKVIAGVKFKPGGFYPFYLRPVIRLADKTLPADIVFPEITPDFTETLLAQKDKVIVQSLEKILQAHAPTMYGGLNLIRRVMEKIEEDKQPQTVSSIARSVGRSERALQLLFHHHVGVSLKWVINRKRLLRTIDKVVLLGLSWTNAAAETGYSNQSHFTREFKQATGLSPSVYLKSLQKK